MTTMILAHVPLDFLVLGLPRSATTWLANWLTTDRSLCLHDPFAEGMPEQWPRDGRLRGISCTGAALMPHWLAGYDCPVAVIERDPGACDTSLAALGLPGTVTYRDAVRRAPGRRFAFADLWTEAVAAALWNHLLPSIPFDALRYRLLRHWRVQPVQPGAHTPHVTETLLGSGLLTGAL